MSTLKLTAIIFEGSTPGVFIGRIKEIGGIFAQNDSVRQVLSDLDTNAWHMLHSYKQAEARALLAEQDPTGDGELSAIEVVHDEIGSAVQHRQMKLVVPPRSLRDKPELTPEEVKQEVERVKALFRAAGQELYDLDAKAVKAGVGHELDAFYPLLQEIETYISEPNWSSPHARQQRSAFNLHPSGR
jgi:hypothetical protein